MSTSNIPHVSIIILNWNNWKDTLTCLESVFDLEYPNLSVVVCDNHSTDHSLEKIRFWLKEVHNSKILKYEFDFEKTLLSNFPFTVEEYLLAEPKFGTCFYSSDNPRRLITLIDTGSNLGYGGGNNVGLRYALSRFDSKYFWILNNDTAVEPDSLCELVHFAESSSRIHLVGSLILDFEKPFLVQMAGGASYNALLGVSHQAFQGINVELLQKLYPNGIPNSFDFVSGAALFTSRELLNTIGLFDEQYFLYHEEIDLTERSRGLFESGFCQKSIVYHKQSATIPKKGNKSLMGEFYDLRSRLLFMKKHHPQNLLVFYSFLFLICLKNLVLFDFRRIKLIVSIIFFPRNHFEHRD